jgi:hypothetical protein
LIKESWNLKDGSIPMASFFKTECRVEKKMLQDGKDDHEVVVDSDIDGRGYAPVTSVFGA